MVLNKKMKQLLLVGQKESQNMKIFLVSMNRTIKLGPHFQNIVNT